MNTPAIALCNKDFLNDARSAASSKGLPGLRIVPETVPCECNIIQQIESRIGAAMADIVAALTKPLTAEEKSPKQKEVEELSRIVFKGNLEEVNRFFYRRGWTDGLPIIPPTEEAVAEMLTGTDLPADRVVDKIIPRLGKATVEKIAINAVMAGALPTYMPVLITGVQAVMDPDSGFISYEVSTGSFMPFWILNGAIRKDLNVNSGQGALSPGNIANATIGRAMGLIIKNIGGARNGIEDMGTLGNPGKYTMVTAENEEESPWEPLHVERGFDKEDCTVTVSFPNSFWQLTQYGSDDKGILRSVVYNLHPSTSQLCLMLTPTHAKFLADAGWSKEEIATFVSEYARAPLYRFTQYYGNMLDRSTNQRAMLMNPEDSVSILGNPDMIWIFVGGGAGQWIGVITGPKGLITKKLDLPANWHKLVRKYKEVVPKYVRY